MRRRLAECGLVFLRRAPEHRERSVISCVAYAASRGSMTKCPPIGIMMRSGLYYSPMKRMSPKRPVSPMG